jgi:hypothetical protein
MSGAEATGIGVMLAVVFVLGTIAMVLYLKSDLYPAREACPSCKRRALRRAHVAHEEADIDGKRRRESVGYWRCMNCHARFRRPIGLRLEPVSDEEWIRHCGSRI